MKTLRERFDAKWIPEPNSGCWLWTASLGSHGYGQIAVATGIPDTAPRVSYGLYNGVIPIGLHVLHRCDNRLCVNPDHLFLGTNADNISDRLSKNRPKTGLRGPRHLRAKLTAEQVEAIRRDRRSTYAIARDYPVKATTISSIKRGATWRSM